MVKKHGLLLLAPLFAGALGCGGSGLVVAAGRVTLDGRPVAGATLMFHPEGPEGRPAFAISDGEGRFSVSTSNQSGIRPGRYKVTVTRTEASEIDRAHVPAGVDVKKLEGGETAERRDLNTMKRNKMRTVRNTLPAPYADARKTTIAVSVPPGGTKDLDIALTEKPG